MPDNPTPESYPILRSVFNKFLMPYKYTLVAINILLVTAAAFCLQGCSHTPTSIGRALVIGISTNQSKDNPTLPTPAVDAENFGEALSSSANIPPKYLRVITAKDEQQTRENLLNELRQFAAQTSKNDVAWLMIEGRGVEINAENYFYVVDSKQENGKPTKETMVSMHDITESLERMQAKELIITIAQNANPSQNPNKYLDKYFISLSETQWPVNWKIPLGVHSVVTFNFSGWERSIPGYPLINTFTYFLSKGLYGGAADQGGEVKIKNLIHYTQLGVASSIRLYGGNIGACAWSVTTHKKSDALATVLAKDTLSGFGGETAVSLQSHPSAREKCDAALLRAFELQLEIEQHMRKKAKIADALKSQTLLQFTRASLAPVKSQIVNALRFDPSSPKANYELGDIEIKMCYLDNAQKHLEKVINLVPNAWSPVSKLALLMQRERKYQKAEVLYEKAIKLAPNNAVIKYNLATLYEDSHQLQKAQNLLLKIIKKNPKWSSPVHALAYIYFVKRDKKTQMELLKKAYELDPNNINTLHTLAIDFCHEYKNYQKSEQFYRRLIKLSPFNSRFRKEFTECLSLQGKNDEAKFQAKKAIDLGWPSNDPLFKKIKLN